MRKTSRWLFATIMIFLLTGCGRQDTVVNVPAIYGPEQIAEGTASAEINGMSFNWYASEDMAITNASALVLTEANNALSCDLDTVEITVTGIVTNNSFSSRNLIDGVKSSVTGFLGGNPPVSVSDDGTAYIINAQAFDNEAVLITAEFGNGSELDRKFGKGINKGYFAFTVPAMPKAEPDSEDGGNGNDGNSGNNGGVAGKVQEIVDFWTDDNFAVVEENVDEFLDENDIINQNPPSNATIILNGSELGSYETPTEAVKNRFQIDVETSKSLEVKASVDSSNTSRVRLFVMNKKGTNMYQEVFMTSQSGWTTTIDLSQYAGKTIIVGICTSDMAVIPKSVYRYVGVHIA